MQSYLSTQVEVSINHGVSNGKECTKKFCFFFFFFLLPDEQDGGVGTSTRDDGTGMGMGLSFTTKCLVSS